MLRYLVFSSVLPVCAGLATPGVALGTKPYYTVPIDYSAANEFITEHYGLSQSYFRDDHATESIYNARQGYFDGDALLEPSLSNCGFELVQLREPASHNVDWNDLKSVREHFLPRVEEAIRSSLGEECISDIFFWNPTMRSHDSKASDRNADMESQTTPRSIQAGMAHIDSDVNAYESIEQFLNVVAANIIPGTKPLPLDQVLESLNDEQRRFAIFNAWCNIGSTKILQAPLAFMPMRYKQANTAFPLGQPDFEDSRWYTFPEMEPNELLLFTQYDRDAAQPSDVWHCALKSVGANEDVPPRKSFDVRAFVVLKDNVPEHRDRLAQRVTSILDFKESQAFCAEQGERRKHEQT